MFASIAGVKGMTVLARFDNSGHYNWRTDGAWSTYEGTFACGAETPIGQAVACPEIRRKLPPGFPRWRSHNCPDEFCVYVGHNWLGNEMHWLPRPYLKKWWEANYAGGRPGEDLISTLLDADSSSNGSLCSDLGHDRLPGETWVQSGARWRCSEALELKVDAWAKLAMGGRSVPRSWSFAYASLPMLRVTMIRDPFTWLLSMHGWDNLYKRHKLDCSNISEATREWGQIRGNLEVGQREPGWAHTLALRYILVLCGEDCQVRWSHRAASIADLERQANENLRYSFAVVGLSSAPEVFYKMIATRVQYMGHLPLSANRAKLKNSRHPGCTPGAQCWSCKHLYNDSAVQRQFIEASPAIAALDRLFHVGVQVNEFQLRELQTCGAWDEHGPRDRGTAPGPQQGLPGT